MTDAPSPPDPFDPAAPRPPAPLRPRIAPETWGRAQADYAHGASTAVIGERYGIHPRTVRRRAAEEGWARRGRPGGEPVLGAGWPQAPREAGGPREPDEEFRIWPGLKDAVTAYGYEVSDLLLDPDPSALRRFAFRRSAEAATAGGAAEALAWMRLVQATDRVSRQIARDNQRFRDVDYQRAAYLAQLKRLAPEEPLFADDEADEDPLGDAPDGGHAP